MAGYVEMLAAFKQEQATIPQMQRRLCWGRDTMYRLVVALHAHGLLHISGWHREPGRRPPAVYSFGPGQDAAPSSAACLVLRPLRPSSEVISFACIVREFDEPSTLLEAIDHSGAHRTTVTVVVEAMRQHGLLRVYQWRPRENCGGIYQAVFSADPGKDAPYPSRKEMRRRTRRAWEQRQAARQASAAILHALAGSLSAVRAGARLEAA